MKQPAANPVQPSAPLTLGGVEYRLVYNYRAIAEAEQVINRGRATVDHVNLLYGIYGMMSAMMLPPLFWAALRKYHPKITLDQATDLIHPGSVAEISSAVTAAFDLATPEADRKDPTPASAAGENAESS